MSLLAAIVGGLLLGTALELKGRCKGCSERKYAPTDAYGEPINGDQNAHA